MSIHSIKYFQSLEAFSLINILVLNLINGLRVCMHILDLWLVISWLFAVSMTSWNGFFMAHKALKPIVKLYASHMTALQTLGNLFTFATGWQGPCNLHLQSTSLASLENQWESWLGRLQAEGHWIGGQFFQCAKVFPLLSIQGGEILHMLEKWTSGLMETLWNASIVSLSKWWDLLVNANILKGSEEWGLLVFYPAEVGKTQRPFFFSWLFCLVGQGEDLGLPVWWETLVLSPSHHAWEAFFQHSI